MADPDDELTVPEEDCSPVDVDSEVDVDPELVEAISVTVATPGIE
jgi:hypothetical protein